MHDANKPILALCIPGHTKFELVSCSRCTDGARHYTFEGHHSTKGREGTVFEFTVFVNNEHSETLKAKLDFGDLTGNDLDAILDKLANWCLRVFLTLAARPPGPFSVPFKEVHTAPATLVAQVYPSDAGEHTAMTLANQLLGDIYKWLDPRESMSLSVEERQTMRIRIAGFLGTMDIDRLDRTTRTDVE